jgi:hypothetical protein
MNYSFDIYGWLSDEPIEGRTTEVAPPDHGEKITGESYPNFLGLPGKEWVMIPYAAVPAVPTPEPPTDPVVYETRLTQLEFMRRFTMDELDAVYGAAESGTPETRRLRIGLEMLRMADFVSTADPLTTEFATTLEAAGLIATGRAAQILG